MVIAGAPFGLPGQAQLLPAIALASVFFWSLFRPVAFPPPFVFVLGLLADLMEEMPPGVSVLILLLTRCSCCASGARSANRVSCSSG